MTDVKQSKPEVEPIDDHHDEDVENDAVIGSAFRTSLIVLIFLMLPVIGLLVYLNIEKSRETAVEFEPLAPEVRQSNEEPIPSLPMEVVTDQSGIEFVHETGRYGEKLLPETMGSGVAVLDFNQDGHLDLLLVNSSRWSWDSENAKDTPSKLYAGDGNFNFTDVSAETGFDFSIYGMGGGCWRL